MMLKYIELSTRKGKQAMSLVRMGLFFHFLAVFFPIVKSFIQVVDLVA